MNIAIYFIDCVSGSNSCVFPYTYKGVTCTGPNCCNLNDDASGPWCSTKVDGRGVHISGEYEYCSGPCKKSGSCTSSVSNHNVYPCLFVCP